MDIGTLLVIGQLGATGYGEATEGRPNAEQRAIVVYTNYARVDPDAWASDYANGGCNTGQFTTSERTPKTPLAYHDGLTEVAQLHSEDMDQHNTMQHDSLDGTPWDERIWPYYPDGNTIAENVAAGYDSARSVVLEGWMCSPGHRSNVMEADFDHVGTGASGGYWTQDFGGGAGGERPAVALGAHEVAGGTVTFAATWSEETGPATLAVETDSDCLDMALVAGDGALGAWEAEASNPGGCTPYRFVWKTADGTLGAVPSTGAWYVGSGCPAWDDAALDSCALDDDRGDDDSESDGDDTGQGPDDDQAEPATECDEEEYVDPQTGNCRARPAREGGAGGCATLPGGGGLTALCALLLGLARRRNA